MEGNRMSWSEKNALWIFIIGLIASFFYLWGVVQPPLIFQHQQPSFFFGADVFAKYASYPGGFVDYLSAFFTQFYTVSFVGALLITLVIAGISFSARKVFQVFNLGVVAPILTLLLMGLLLSLHSNYFYTLSFSLAMLVPLVSYLVFRAVTGNRFFYRLLLFVIFAMLLYIIAAAASFLFVLLAVLNELFLVKGSWLKKSSTVLLFLLVAVLWPLCMHEWLFLFNSKDIYTYLLPFNLVFSFTLLLKMSWLLIIVSPFVGGVLTILNKSGFLAGKESKQPIREVVLFFVLFLGLAVFVRQNFDGKHKIVIQIDKFAEDANWRAVLQKAQEHPDVLHRLITLHYNRALYHTGQLIANLFAYPQIEGENGLIRNTGPAFEYAYATASLMFEMGNVNSAQSWANEALSVESESARILKLLALIHLYKKELNAAEIYITKVSKTIGGKQWAKHYTQLLNEPHRIGSDPAFAHVDKKTINTNFLIRYGYMYGELKMLNDSSTLSPMAFEYLLAYNLLARRLDRVATLAPTILKLPYKTLPRHLEEALVLIGMSGTDYGVHLNAFDFQASKIEDLRTFMAVVAKHNNNPQYAQGELLQKFGDTYWYYHIYHQGQELK